MSNYYWLSLHYTYQVELEMGTKVYSQQLYYQNDQVTL